MDTLTDKGCQVRVEYDLESDYFYGVILNIKGVISFQGRSIEELKQALSDSVEEYLLLCKEIGVTPEKSFFALSYLMVMPCLFNSRI
ncbi:MAG: type II toxin-antitoxin system HicB family antitoxin [Desulfovibrio sp.]|uniref:type II toxin-antitoxin system HicB family antitoxin n=1 Tax=Desulfovibrio sp. TaxID=885 RepID=UPI001A7084B8|nr:type II toxin-antitoxin system HicB family antitoxin [Desulfovibrio sp.]MBD5418407.1 type II toxin-antitoxin system HicB family antitoxin [Desulfovibrio sp.]